MLRLSLPALLLALALIIERGWPGLLPAPPVLLVASRVLLLATFLLAGRFRRARIAWAAAALALAQEAGNLEAGNLVAGVLFSAVTLLLPLHLALAAWMREGRLLSSASTLRFAVLGIEALTVAALTRPSLLPLGTLLGQPFLPAPIPADLALPHAGLMSLAVALLAVGARLLRRPGAMEVGLATALGAVAAAALSGASTFYLGIASLVLLVALLESAFSLAFEDGLTGLPGRRALEEVLPDLPSTYALGMVDVDHFKRLNDRHGHEVGDQVLRLVGRLLGKVGGGGQAFRYGGEEFTVVFAGLGAAEAEPHLEALRQTIADYPFTVRSPERPRKGGEKAAASRGRSKKGKGGDKALAVTVSIGVSSPGGKRHTPEQVLKAADQALYRSKKNGRNRLSRIG